MNPVRSPDRGRLMPRGAQRKVPLPAGLIILSSVVLLPDEARADFYVWDDERGRRVVSTIPRHGYTENASLRDAFNPNSIVYQHGRVRDVLSEHYAANVRPQQEDQTVAVTPVRDTPMQRSRRDRTPREGTMNLQELIELERRGGRYRPLDSGQSKY